MTDNDKLETLLTEIRDAQRQQLDEYRRIAGEALAIQKQASERQQAALLAHARNLRLYRTTLLVAALLAAVLLWEHFVRT